VPDSQPGAVTTSDTDLDPRETRKATDPVRFDAAKAVGAARARLSEVRRSDPERFESPEESAGKERARLQRELIAHGVPRRYAEATWDEAPDYPELREWRVPIILRAKLHAGRGLMLFGPVGTGKSSVAALLCGEVVKLGLSVAWEYTQSLLDSLYEGAAGTVSRLKSPSLLVLDDFGVSQMGAYHIKELEKIVEARYRARRSTVVTGNLDPAALSGDEKLQRIVDRWKQANTPLYMPGQSRRKPEDG